MCFVGVAFCLCHVDAFANQTTSVVSITTQVSALKCCMFSVFIQKEEGTLLKAVNYDGEMFIIEEVQLFKNTEPIKILKFSNVTVRSNSSVSMFTIYEGKAHVSVIAVFVCGVQGQLYAGSDSGAAQIPLATCERSSSCMDCVLSRDPYCGWDKAARKCALLSSSQG